jgi:hypothetical protein
MVVIMRLREMVAASMLLALLLHVDAGGAVDLEKRKISGQLHLSASDMEKRTISGRLPSSAVSQPSPLAGEPVTGAVPDYQWWYGCSPTAAGMLIGYYDIYGYAGETYNNLIPGAVAERSTFPSFEGSWDYAAQGIIASPRHVSDFYDGGYLATGDDVPGAPTSALNSLADFMGTSQDAFGNENGATAFWFFTDGSRLTVADLYNTSDVAIYGNSGSYGIYEFMRWAGYVNPAPENVDFIFNQFVDTLGLPDGFRLSDYLAEINAGRVVLLHLENHTMLGYGYDSTTGELLFHDTANPGENRMYWGGTYFGYRMIGVTVVNLSGIAGDVKEPSARFIIPIINLLLSD